MLVGHRLAVGAEPAGVGEARVSPIPLEEFAEAEPGSVRGSSIRRWVYTQRWSSAFFQSAQEISWSWHQPLLLSPWVRAISAPPVDHRLTLGEEQRGQENPAFSGPSSSRMRWSSVWSLDAAIPGTVLIISRPDVLKVGLIVLLVVGDKVVEGVKPSRAVMKSIRHQRAPTVVGVENTDPRWPASPDYRS